MTSSYFSAYKSWQENPEAFWAEAAKEIDWFSKWDKVFDENEGTYGRWFTGATCNTCYNAVDRHLETRAEQAALIYDSPITGKKKSYSFKEFHAEIQALAASLQDMGVKKGDRVIIYLPMIPQASMAMLACARIGAVHSVVFGGFAANELATRIDDCEPKMIISASCGLEPNRVVEYKPLLDEAIKLATHKPSSTLILQREEHGCELIDGHDFDYENAVNAHLEKGTIVPCEPLLATDPLYILYTSGTTGAPKGVVRDNGGHMVAMKWSMKAVYNVEPGEVYWAASDVGWVVGHSYIVYAPLLHGCTTIIFEGKPIGTPDAGTFWRVIEEHKVTTLFTAPTAFRAIKREDPKGEYTKKYDLSNLRALYLAGERADPDTIHWAEEKLNVPVYDHWWQTETSWTIAGNPVGLGALPIKYGSPTVAMPGYDIQVLDDEGHKVANGTLGNVVVKLPLPPGCLTTLWNAQERFEEAYLNEFPGFYKTADAGILDDDNYLFIMARTDDIINVAGHRLSTGGMEEAIAFHPDVAECAVIGVADKLKGQSPVGFLIINSGTQKSEADIEKEVVALVREKIGPVAAFKNAITVQRLPKTRSGKILRGTMQKIADGMEWKMPATIDDPAILDEISQALKTRGLG
ncbi:MAG: propionyl-CoA synthetase [Nitratireductor sp.]